MIKWMKCIINGGHNYQEINRQLIECGTNKLFTYECDNCGTVKRRTL